MNVWFIIMQFPNPREAFASSDIKAFARAGLKIQVHSLRFKHKQNRSLIIDRELGNVKISHNSIYQIIRGLIYCTIYPSIFISLLWFIIYNHINNLDHLLKSIVLLPRVISLFTEIRKKKTRCDSSLLVTLSFFTRIFSKKVFNNDSFNNVFLCI